MTTPSCLESLTRLNVLEAGLAHAVDRIDILAEDLSDTNILAEALAADNRLNAKRLRVDVDALLGQVPSPEWEGPDPVGQKIRRLCAMGRLADVLLLHFGVASEALLRRWASGGTTPADTAALDAALALVAAPSR